ncbi:uncharacterized protein FTJAE_9160 [Fusarium tjaetaba]|uniref:Uncharacterized protein n=1 Tax=Fusarium tjaetaba TaxID=1567544 RepID=A0A8H5R777_9HYPO|nr:uncharacterized protein FTJAE_9160 [Fusarium tjaetaba]KAF5627673.1 hypothetical protein FTJAE_9160 [Fusarium tjaetaba]
MALGTPRRPSINVSVDEEDATESQTRDPGPDPDPDKAQLSQGRVSATLYRSSVLTVAKKKVKGYIGRVVNESPDAAEGITTTDMIKRNLQELPQPELFMVLDGLFKQMYKIEGIQRQVPVDKANLRRAER